MLLPVISVSTQIYLSKSETSDLLNNSCGSSGFRGPSISFRYRPPFSLGLSVSLFLPTTLPTLTPTPTPPPLPLLPPLSTLYSRRRTLSCTPGPFLFSSQTRVLRQTLSPGLPPSLPFLEFSRLINRQNRFIVLVSLDLNKPAEEVKTVFRTSLLLLYIFSQDALNVLPHF